MFNKHTSRTKYDTQHHSANSQKTRAKIPLEMNAEQRENWNVMAIKCIHAPPFCHETMHISASSHFKKANKNKMCAISYFYCCKFMTEKKKSTPDRMETCTINMNMNNSERNMADSRGENERRKNSNLFAISWMKPERRRINAIRLWVVRCKCLFGFRLTLCKRTKKKVVQKTFVSLFFSRIVLQEMDILTMP